ncbi:excisionase family DNA binding protein [Mumia flava]|uniref:Excisionase family DNA binding protein n=1 Tax=Mumia flava TaxID=1348852 RepID=A0A0B2BIM8_9ACTN|nr:helix-turn-helix domain-containing protein [Mumia flava]PJJ58550.1 excisionase family DNA binding protein [Mumia flava]
MPIGSSTPRFLTLADVAEVLNVSERQAYALVRRGELRAIRVGGKGTWRVETSALEEYISGAYQAAADHIAAHPFADEDVSADI